MAAPDVTLDARTTNPSPARGPAGLPGGVGTILVSGGASGLGAAVVAAVRDAGGTPLALDRMPVPSAEHEIVDLADGRATELATRRLVERTGGRLDGVFTAAGTDRPAPFGALDGAGWERIVGVNLLGTAAVIRGALPRLEASAGRIVTCASTLGLRVAGDASAYCASKFGIVGFTRALAEEFKGRLGVTLLVPGGMTTAFFDDREEQYKPGPDAKLNRPEDVARTVLFALAQPPGCEIRELVVTSSWETSYP
ncbi:short-chain alcohol dehydrogenase [Frankia sp. QA3]|nr:SDR family oxidoreductase [Frankia sp. QA3]EIV91501.1 short-chain alcohol dehydrogenase [Frankia sp. QA3]